MSLKSTIIELLKAFIVLVKTEPGQMAEIETLKAKIADLNEQLQGSMVVDDELRSVVAEAAEAASAATHPGEPVVEPPPAQVVEEAPPAVAEQAPVAEPTPVDELPVPAAEPEPPAPLENAEVTPPKTDE